MSKENIYVKYPSIPLLDSCPEILEGPVKVFEKLDGGNCQISISEGKLIPGSRSRPISGNRIQKVSWFGDFTKWVYSSPQLYNLDENQVLFGEWLSFHNVDYNPEKIDQFYLFDVYDRKTGQFLDYPRGLESLEAREIDLNCLETLTEGTISLDDLKQVLARESEYRDSFMEGVVVKNYEQQKFAKLVRPEFSEVARGNRLPNIEKYMTEARVRKARATLNENEVEPTPDNLVKEIMRNVKSEHGVSLSKRDIQRKLKGK
jgi:ATP-dependent RNA circularization protein (DNA/RNA ligase family)